MIRFLRWFFVWGALAVPFAASADGGLNLLKLSGHRGISYATIWKIHELTHVLGTKQKLDVLGFAGIGDRNRPVTGLAISAPIKISSELTLNIGPAIAISGGKPVDVGGVIGLTWRF